MNGSGTTTLEAYLLDRHGIGYDFDPLAVKIAAVKTTLLNVDGKKLTKKVLGNAKKFLNDQDCINEAFNTRFDSKTKDFINYWFFPETQKELMSLILAIEQYKKGTPIRELLEVLYSSIIVTKSGGVSRARDLAHTRPHLDHNKQPRSTFDAFEQRILKFSPIISELPNHRYQSVIKQGDAKNLDIDNDSVDLIVTSPPYANAIDYMRAHKFSLVWLGRTIPELSSLRSRYIGSETVKNIEQQGLPPFTEGVLSELASRDRKKEAVLRKYFMEMREF